MFISVSQISLMVAKDAELHKSKLQFFMEQFYGTIRRMDSSSKELSIAIRGYGLFASVCAEELLWSRSLLKAFKAGIHVPCILQFYTALLIGNAPVSALSVGLN